MHPDFQPYIRLTAKSRLEKSIHSLLGLLRGITADLKVSGTEIHFLKIWISENESLRERHPYNEIFPILTRSLDDGLISDEERDDLIWVCERLCSNNFYDEITTGLQELHGILGGVASDGIISDVELRSIQSWMEDNEQLRRRWPYDEIESIIISTLADGRISDDEHKELISFFAQFSEVLDDKTLASPVVLVDSTLRGVCANSPDFVFQNSRFCLTGASSRYTREVFTDKIIKLGGEVVSGVSKKLNYLVIGGDGNPCWSYACYGRKVEKAIELRKAGAKIQIVHEFDFHDAVEDQL